MSKGNGKSVARGVPGAHGGDMGQAGQVSEGSKRCLDPLTSTIEVSFQELYRYLPDPGEDENDGEERFLDGDYLDLEPAFRDAVVLALPLSPLCREDCPGLCVECGVKLADVGPEHGHGDKVDPRWGLLAKLDIHDTTE
jgi:uncharacterized protein